MRLSPSTSSAFNEIIVLNDTPLKIDEIQGEFALISKQNGDSGWIRLRNLTKSKRIPGLDKSLIKTEVITPDSEYVRGIKLYGIGIKADPGASKLGKGDFHLISPIWVNDLCEFVATNREIIQIFLRNAAKFCKENDGTYNENAFEYLLNSSHYLFNRSLASGFKENGHENLKMATFLLMAAAELDDFPFEKYSSEQSRDYRRKFLEFWLSPSEKSAVLLEKSARFAVPTVDFSLLPYITMERFGINSSLSGLKYEDPLQELREGFKLSKRVDYLLRHFTSVHGKHRDEDHIIHALWNFHAIYHNLTLFPKKNDLVDFSTKNAIEFRKYDPTTSLDLIDSKENAQNFKEILKYDWNEGVIPPPLRVIHALKRLVDTPERLKWYPHLAGGHFLKKNLVKYVATHGGNTQISDKNLLITNGSDDALILICQRFSGNGKRVLIPLPTYEHFVVNVEATGSDVRKFSQKNLFCNELAELRAQIDYHSPNLVYLVSPNNPTGTVWPSSSVKTLVSAYSQTVFIVDEAYFEFGDGSSCVNLVETHENLVVTRTASKAFCLAAVRCGYLVAHEKLVAQLSSNYNPKSVNEFAQIAFAEALLCFEEYYQPYIKEINESREKFVRGLGEMGIRACSGGFGNFVCVWVGEDEGITRKVCEKLKEKDIYVRDIGQRVKGFIRITVGLDMGRVALALKEILGGEK